MSKELKDMSFKEIVDWATGELVVSIGEGKLRERVWAVLTNVNMIAYERGFANENATKNEKVSKQRMFLAVVPGDYTRADADVFQSEAEAESWVADRNESSGKSYATIKEITV